MSRIRDSYSFLTEAHIQAARAYAEANPQPRRPIGIAEAHLDWRVTERGVVRQASTQNLPPRLSELTPELMARIVEESVGAASDEESTTLSGWCIYEARLAHTPDVLSHHLVGWAEEAHEGRTSSAVVEIDVAARTARTESGRIYRLRGKPGPGGDARHVWDRFVRNNRATDVRDITDKVFSIVAQLGMPEAAEIEFEPTTARSDSPPSNESVDENGLSLSASSFTVEGEIVEVLPGLGLAHMRGADGVVYGLNPKTPGIAFEALRVGLQLRCQVTTRFHRVLHAALLP